MRLCPLFLFVIVIVMFHNFVYFFVFLLKVVIMDECNIRSSGHPTDLWCS
jgi:hypothetical protein